jgi:hypothetical protein
VTNLDRVITEIQREAADIPTQDLRSDIQVGLDVLEAAISDLHALRPETDVIARISATADFMETVITIALYVRELAKRPADEPTPVVITLN